MKSQALESTVVVSNEGTDISSTPQSVADQSESSTTQSMIKAHEDDDEDDDEEEEPEVLAPVAVFALLVTTVIIGICAEFLVGSLEGLSEKANISRTFIGIIILPIVGNAAGECFMCIL